MSTRRAAVGCELRQLTPTPAKHVAPAAAQCPAPPHRGNAAPAAPLVLCVLNKQFSPSRGGEGKHLFVLHIPDEPQTEVAEMKVARDTKVF